MESTTNLVDMLYTRFILRDFVAKILPGSLLLGAGLSFPRRWPFLQIGLNELPLLAWGLLLGLAFVFGFSVQAIGEWSGWARIYGDRPSRDRTARQEAIGRLVRLHRLDEPWAVQQRERYVVLKEMAANFSLSVIISLILLISTAVSWRLGVAARILLLVLSVGTFYWFNRIQAIDQKLLEEELAPEKPPTSRSRRKKAGA